MKKLLFLLPLLLLAEVALAVSGDARKTVMSDTNGNVISTPLTFSNQVSMIPSATTDVQVVNYTTMTNYVAGTAAAATTNVTVGLMTTTNIIVTVSNKVAYIVFTNASGYVTPTVTNGLASTGWVATSYLLITGTNSLANTNWVTSNFLPTAGTNSLASTNWVATTYLPITGTNGLAAWAGVSNYVDGATNGLGTAATNGLAAWVGITNYVGGATQNLVTATITNGLASVVFVQGAVDGATNGLSSALTNGLAAWAGVSNYVGGATQSLVTITVTNGLAAWAGITNYVGGATNGLAIGALLTNGTIAMGANLNMGNNELTNAAAITLGGTRRTTWPTGTASAATNISTKWTWFTNYGGTDTAIVRFQNQLWDYGTGSWTVTTNAANAMTVTILENGQYAINVNFNNQVSSAGVGIGISVDSTNLTKSIELIAAAHRLGFRREFNGAEAQYANVSWAGYLGSGSVVRAHARDGGTPYIPSDITNCQFEIQQLSK